MAKAPVFLRAQSIDDNDGVVGRVRRARRLSDDDGVVRRGRGIENAPKGSVTMMEAARIWGQRRSLRRCNDGTEELVNIMEALAEEDEPEVSTMATEASSEESENTTRPSEHLRWRRRRCVYGIRVSTTMTTASAE